MPWSWFADWLIGSGKLGRTNVRKLSSIVGLIGPAIGLALLAFASCNHVLPVVYLCIACGTNGALYSGYQVRLCHTITELYYNFLTLNVSLNISIDNTTLFILGRIY